MNEFDCLTGYGAGQIIRQLRGKLAQLEDEARFLRARLRELGQCHVCYGCEGTVECDCGRVCQDCIKVTRGAGK